jgi:putative DNA primase/helicase
MTDTTTVPKVAPKHDLDYITTDSGNADRLIREHGEDFRYCEPLGGWLHWNGVRWQLDNAAIHQRARELGKTLLVEAADESDNHIRNTLIQHARYTLGHSGIERMVKEAKKYEQVIVSPDLFDADPYLINCWNGTVDVKTGKLHDHRREDLITKLAPVAYDPKADDTEWARFLERVIPDKDLRDFLRTSVGY